MYNSALIGNMLGQGNTAEIFEWDRDKILKLYRPEMPDNFCLYEFKVSQYAHEHLKITPKPIEVINFDGRIGAIYERIDGKTMLKLMISRPWKMSTYSKMLARYHIDIQQPVNITVNTVKEKLRREIESVSLLSTNEKKSIYNYLDALPDGNTLCHFDFHPDNIMISSKQCYVIDWMTGCMGDPLSDVARTSLILNYAEIPRVPFVVNILAGVLKKSINKIYLRKYVASTGASISDIKKWELPLAAARLCEWVPDGESKRLFALVKKKLNNQTDTAST